MNGRRAYSVQISAFSCQPQLNRDGNDCFGRSDTGANLHCFFEVDRSHRLCRHCGAGGGWQDDGKDVAQAIEQCEIDANKVNSDGA